MSKTDDRVDGGKLVVEMEPSVHYAGEDEATFGMGDTVYITGLKQAGGIYGYWRITSIHPSIQGGDTPLTMTVSDVIYHDRDAALGRYVTDAEPALCELPPEEFDGFFIHANEVTDACQKAWPTPQGFSQSPLELVARLIDERDEARPQEASPVFHVPVPTPDREIEDGDLPSGYDKSIWHDPESWGDAERAFYWEWEARRDGLKETAARGELAEYLKVPALWSHIIPAVTQEDSGDLAGLERELFIYWLLRAYRTLQRSGWEEGPSDEETRTDLLHVLANYDYDPNQGKAAKELESRPAAHHLGAARERWRTAAVPLPGEASRPIVVCHNPGHGDQPHEKSLGCFDWVSRRIRLDLISPAERAIHDAIQAVEAVGGSVELTEAVILLGQAKDKVADHIEAHWQPSPEAREPVGKEQDGSST